MNDHIFKTTLQKSYYSPLCCAVMKAILLSFLWLFGLILLCSVAVALLSSVLLCSNLTSLFYSSVLLFFVNCLRLVSVFLGNLISLICIGPFFII